MGCGIVCGRVPAGDKKCFFDADCHFSTVKREMEQYLFDVSDICQLIPVAEKILLNRLNERHQNQTVFQAVARILEKRGNLLRRH